MRISVLVDSHGGERERRGEELRARFLEELEKLCADERFNNDAITVTL